MAGQQTSISETPTVAIAGALVDLNGNNDVKTYVSEEASAEIPFGVMLKQGSADNGCLLIADAGDVAEFIGVAVHSNAYNKDNELGDTGVKPDVAIGVLQKGTIWVEVEEAVTPLSTVRVRMVATGDEVFGAFRDTADDTTDCANIGQFARYLTSASAGGLAQLQIDMTMRNSAVADS